MVVVGAHKNVRNVDPSLILRYTLAGSFRMQALALELRWRPVSAARTTRTRGAGSGARCSWPAEIFIAACARGRGRLLLVSRTLQSRSRAATGPSVTASPAAPARSPSAASSASRGPDCCSSASALPCGSAASINSTGCSPTPLIASRLLKHSH